MHFKIKNLKFWRRGALSRFMVGSRRVRSWRHIQHTCLDSTA